MIVLQTDRNTIENLQFSVYVCGETKIVDAEITDMYNNALSLIESEASKRWNEKKQIIVKKIDEKLSTINNELKSTIDVIEALKPMMDSNKHSCKKANYRQQDLEDLVFGTTVKYVLQPDVIQTVADRSFQNSIRR